MEPSRAQIVGGGILCPHSLKAGGYSNEVLSDFILWSPEGLNLISREPLWLTEKGFPLNNEPWRAPLKYRGGTCAGANITN